MQELKDRVYEAAFPYYERAKAISPVKHIDIVVGFAEEIAAGEDLDPVSRRILVIAAVLHDIGLALSNDTRKIVESEIAKASGKERSSLINKAVKQRKDHMVKGAALSRIILDNKGGIDLMETDITDICSLIENHDNVKIAKVRKDKKWLNKKDAWLLQLLNEADALWMLTPEGIETDIERGSGFTHEQQMGWNINNHKKVYDLYAFYKKAASYGFIDKTMYRSKTGYGIFKRLTR